MDDRRLGGAPIPLRRPTPDVVLAIALVAYGLLYLAWQVFRWGGPDVELLIADAAFIPIGVMVIALALRAARSAPAGAARRAWLLIGLAFAAYCAGDVTWFWLEVVRNEAPYPSIADLFYIAFYPILALGLVTLPRERAENPLRLLLDMAIVIVGAITIVWFLVLEPIVAATSSDLDATLVALAYPVGDLLVLFVVAATLMSRLIGTSRTALVLLGLGLVLNVVADLVYARLLLEESYESGAWLDACYLFGWVLMGLACFVQGRVRVGAQTAGMADAAIRPITAPPYLAVGAVYLLLLAATEMQGSSMRVVVAGAVIVTALVVARQVLTSRENARLLAERASSQSAARFQAIIQNANDVIAVVDPEATILYLTPSAARLTGGPAESLVGGTLGSMFAPEDVPLAMELVRMAQGRAGAGDTIDCRVMPIGGGVRHVEVTVTNLLEDPVVQGLVVTMHDVTERRGFEKQLLDQAFHDPLTGLANRALLANRIEHALRRGTRHSTNPALLYLDLDDFKSVNDSLGHPVGDRVLVAVAQRISHSLRAGDTAARLGGDEFAILLEDTGSSDDAITVAERLLGELATPLDAGGTAVAIGASVGIVRPEGKGSDPMDLLRDADIAMYEAKREARGSYRLFEKEMFTATVDRVSLEVDLRTALEGGQFEVVYQPLFDLTSQVMTGAEALLRWNHPTRGQVMPMQFIPLAERTGEIVPIGRWVIEQACETVGRWNEIVSERRLRANVNVSARQLEPRFVDDVASILRRTGFPPELLVLEITESVFMADRPGAMEVLVALRSLGVRISIDDFGTGYSSLSALRDLPVDELKIDRSFVDGMTARGDARLVESIIRLSHDLDLTTVAEGVEVEEQLTLLRALGCDAGQGYHLGRPGPANSIEDALDGGDGGPTEELARTA